VRTSWAIPTGSLVLGVTAYAFLVVAARSLEPAAYAPLAALWALIFAVAPALFMPLEQEVTRQLARDDADAPAVVPVLRAAAVCAAVGVAAAILLALPAVPVLQAEAFDGSALLLAGLGLSLLGYALTHLVRGMLLGTDARGLYGASLAAEGVLRLVCAAGLVAVAVSSAGPYGLVLGAAPLIAAAALLPVARGRTRELRRSPRTVHVSSRSMLRSMSLLVLASLLSLTLINAGPVVVKLLARPDEAEQAGRLLAGLVLARLPLFAFPTLQAALLPRFARLAAARDRTAVLALVRRLAVLHGSTTLAVAALAAVAGPPVLSLVFGPSYRLPGPDLALLTVGAAGHLLAMLLGLVLVAGARSAALAVGWLIATAAAGVTLALVDPLLLRVELALLVGAWTAVAVIGLALVRNAGAFASEGAPIPPPIPAAP
jgi:O-antigen/teichoic acid export membrane protein